LFAPVALLATINSSFFFKQYMLDNYGVQAAVSFFEQQPPPIPSRVAIVRPVHQVRESRNTLAKKASRLMHRSHLATTGIGNYAL
jgi:hypothetical protein